MPPVGCLPPSPPLPQTAQGRRPFCFLGYKPTITMDSSREIYVFLTLKGVEELMYQQKNIFFWYKRSWITSIQFGCVGKWGMPLPKWQFSYCCLGRYPSWALSALAARWIPSRNWWKNRHREDSTRWSGAPGVVPQFGIAKLVNKLNSN